MRRRPGEIVHVQVPRPVEMDKLFPVAAGLRTCKALFRTYADHKYADCYSPAFAGRLQAHSAADYDGAFVLGGVDNHWHFLVDHLAKLPLLRHFEGAVPTIVASARIPDGFAHLIEQACSPEPQPPALVKEARPILRLASSFVPCVNDAPRLQAAGISASICRPPTPRPRRSGSSSPGERVAAARAERKRSEQKLIEKFDFVAVDSAP